MDITFKVGDSTATYSRNWFSGKASLAIDGKVHELQNPLNPMTHFGLRLSRFWEVNANQHKIVIEKTRPRVFAGFRSQTYRISVDGNVVAEETGY